MTEENSKLSAYYQYVQEAGHLLTLDHAYRWSDGVLKTLGTVLDRKTKRELKKTLPEELSTSLNGVFWLLHFHDPNMTSEEFCQRVARRSGNSNAEFARVPTQAVFGGLKLWVNGELNEKVASTLSPQIRQLWEQALLAPALTRVGQSDDLDSVG